MENAQQRETDGFTSQNLTVNGTNTDITGSENDAILKHYDQKRNAIAPVTSSGSIAISRFDPLSSKSDSSNKSCSQSTFCQF